MNLRRVDDSIYLLILHCFDSLISLPPETSGFHGELWTDGMDAFLLVPFGG